MDGERPEGGKPTATGPTFSLARVLRSLKQQGSSLLVVGLVSREEYGRVCRRMLGDDDAGPRQRVLVTTEADRKPTVDRVPQVESPSTETTSHLSYVAGCRSASTGEHTTEPVSETNGRPNTDEPSDHRVEANGLDGLAAAIEEEIDTIEADRGGFQPAELRVCIDSLIPLLDTHDRATVGEFLGRVTDRVESADGMCHVHLPVAPDWEGIEAFEAFFDAIVALRVEPGGLQQQWRLTGPGVVSEWLDV